jgi:D-3-phosphoglycerate dehydrogenase
VPGLNHNAPTVVFAEMPEAVGRDISIEREQLPPGTRIQRFAWGGDPDALVKSCLEADAVLTDYVPFNREVLMRLPTLPLISIAATGWDCVDTEAAAEMGVSVASVGEYCTDEVADHTLALLLALNRCLRDYDSQVQLRRDWDWNAVSGIRPLKEQTLGLLGCGRIGMAVARRARGFGLRVLAHDPVLDGAAAAEAGVELATLDQVLRRSDIISLHCPLQPDTAGMLDADAFARMERRPMLINVARGALIVEKDLIAALDTGRISAAALDVLAEEPPDLGEHPLCGRRNVLLTPHVAFYSETALANVRRISADNIRYFLEGRFDRVNRFVNLADTKTP